MKIALLGYSRSGKDTVAAIIADMVPTVPLAFAGIMKDSFHDMFPDIPRDPKPRTGYEKYGGSMREIDKEVWIKKLAKRVSYYDHDFPLLPHIVITDLRHENEAEWCRANGFVIVYVHSFSDIRRERAKGDESWLPVQPSERDIGLIKEDHTIFNNGTLEELEIQTRDIVGELLEKERVSVSF